MLYHELLTSPWACDRIVFSFSSPVTAGKLVSEILTVVGVKAGVVTAVVGVAVPWPTCSSDFPASLPPDPTSNGCPATEENGVKGNGVSPPTGSSWTTSVRPFSLV